MANDEIEEPTFVVLTRPSHEPYRALATGARGITRISPVTRHPLCSRHRRRLTLLPSMVRDESMLRFCFDTS